MYEEYSPSRNIQERLRNRDYYPRMSPGLTNDDFAEFTAKRQDLDNTPLTLKDREVALNNLAKEREAREELRRQAYNQESGRLNIEFRRDAEEYYGFADLPEQVKSVIHFEADERGHSHGYDSIFAEYCNVLEFAIAVIKAMKESEVKS